MVRRQLTEKVNGGTGVWWPRWIRSNHIGILEPLCVRAAVELGLGPHPYACWRMILRRLQWSAFGLHVSVLALPLTAILALPAIA